MKTNIYIFLILLLSFSVAHAQENSSQVKQVKVVTVNELHVNPSVSEITIIQNIGTSKIENTASENSSKIIARTNSDIRIYLNRERNIQNIYLLFPTKYKEILA
tara:strand:- start:508 stop:819 length:312 start_codon:yes stop_codon:yes gene_type:complete